MKLRLQYPPTPENAAALAQLAVDAARNVHHVELDYSPQSLAEVDRIVGQFHTQGMRADQIGETIFSFGCYVGEVLVRHDRAVWKLPQQSIWSRLRFGGTNMMIVRCPVGTYGTPLAKPFSY